MGSEHETALDAMIFAIKPLNLGIVIYPIKNSIYHGLDNGRFKIHIDSKPRDVYHRLFVTVSTCRTYCNIYDEFGNEFDEHFPYGTVLRGASLCRRSALITTSFSSYITLYNIGGGRLGIFCTKHIPPQAIINSAMVENITFGELQFLMELTV